MIAARTVAECTGDEALLRRWLAGLDVPSGLAGGHRLPLAAARQPGAARPARARSTLDDAEEADPTFGGRLAALQARASQPTDAAKAWAWSQVVEESTRSNHQLVALLQGFWATPDLDLVRPYVTRFFTEVPRLSAWVGDDALARVVRFGFPRVVERATLRLAEEALAGRAVARHPAQHRRRRVRARRGGALARAVCAGAGGARREALGGSSSGSW